VLLILPELADLLPSSWDPDVIPYLPSSAGQAVLSVAADPTMMSPWNGFALFVGYALALLAVAAVLLRRRDA
jgi:ABC-2 type transport system permease protein